jgi:3-deoxy-D-manno-octulosonic-acid transferase
VPHGGQNPLEPARLGCPILLGPHIKNFTEIGTRLVKAGAAQPVADGLDLIAALTALLPDRASRARMAAQGRSVADEVAITGRETLAELGPLLDRALGRADART